MGPEMLKAMEHDDLKASLEPLRKKEVDSITLPTENGFAYLTPLWLTAEGYDLLKPRIVSLFAAPFALDSILKYTERVGINVLVEPLQRSPLEYLRNQSPGLRRYLYYDILNLRSFKVDWFGILLQLTDLSLLFEDTEFLRIFNNEVRAMNFELFKKISHHDQILNTEAVTNILVSWLDPDNDDWDFIAQDFLPNDFLMSISRIQDSIIEMVGYLKYPESELDVLRYQLELSDESLGFQTFVAGLVKAYGLERIKEIIYWSDALSKSKIIQRVL
jgi:hypothetical protein